MAFRHAKSLRIFVQARMGSNRLPGKVLMPLSGRPILEHVICNVSNANAKIAVLTSDNVIDDPIVELCEGLKVDVFRGDENDVISRFYRASVFYGCDYFVRVCADSPFINSDIITRVIADYDGEADLLSTRKIDANKNVISYSAKGMSVDLVKTAALKALMKIELDAFEKEHVIPGFFLKGFKCQLKKISIFKGENLCVDTKEDYEKVKNLYTEIKKRVHLMSETL